MEEFNTTGSEYTEDSGVQAGAVAPQDETPEGAGQAGAVAPQDDPDNGSKNEAGEKASGVAARNGERDINAAIRAARLRERTDTEARLAQKADEDIASCGVVNPYTGKPFASIKELREYGEKIRAAERAAKAKKTGRTVEELEAEDEDRAFIREMRRERDAAKKEAESKAARKSFIEKDVVDFVGKYPDIDVAKLETSRDFLEFCGSRFGKEPLAELYASYTKLVGTAGEAALARQSSRNSRSTSGGGAGGSVLTAEQKKSLDRWNAANPDLKMTETEFLKYGKG